MGKEGQSSWERTDGGFGEGVLRKGGVKVSGREAGALGEGVFGKECWSSSILTQCTRKKHIPPSDVGERDGILGNRNSIGKVEDRTADRKSTCSSSLSCYTFNDCY